jgi:hypothetical protein
MFSGPVSALGALFSRGRAAPLPPPAAASASGSASSAADDEDPSMKSSLSKAPDMARNKQLAISAGVLFMVAAVLVLPSLFSGAEGGAMTVRP